MWFVLLAVLLLGGCGGGSEGPSSPPPNPLYVSPTGKDTNEGTFDAPLRSILKAVQIALDDYEIVVAPGTYVEGVTTDRTGTPAQRLRLNADVTGERTASRGSEVRLVLGGRSDTGISISNSSGTTVSGFTITGASGPG